MYTQGVHPNLDFSDITSVARIAEECTSLPVHPRHPYAGDLVFTAFSGSHQDAIKKGFAAQDPNALWEVPYLPIDPADLGRTYDSVIRVNSQSGKGGIAFLLEREHGVVMPRRMQVEFSAVVQRQTDASEGEMSGEALWDLFQTTYLKAPAHAAITCHSHKLDEDGQGIELDVTIDGTRQHLRGQGNGPIAATVDALGLPLRVDHYEERATGTGANAQALAIVEAAMDGVAGSTFGAGASHNIVTASVQAIVSVANRLLLRRQTAEITATA
jgi:2-isopropylmalate synthase